MDALPVFSAQPGMEDMERERGRLGEVLAEKNQVAKHPRASLCWDFTPISVYTPTPLTFPSHAGGRRPDMGL